MAEPVPFRAVLSADLFERAMACLSTEETRYYLMGVHVSAHPDGGAVLVSTDGHTLICIRDADAFVEGEAIVRLNPAMAKAISKPSHRLLELNIVRPMHLVVSGDRACLAAVPEPKEEGETRESIAFGLLDRPTALVGAYQWHGVLINGVYPAWVRVIPTEWPKVPASGGDRPARAARFNGHYLHRLAVALRSLTDGRKMSAPISIVGADEGTPHFVFGKLETAFGIVMPMREERDVTGIPEWFERYRAPAIVAADEQSKKKAAELEEAKRKALAERGLAPSVASGEGA